MGGAPSWGVVGTEKNWKAEKARLAATVPQAKRGGTTALSDPFAFFSQRRNCKLVLKCARQCASDPNTEAEWSRVVPRFTTRVPHSRGGCQEEEEGAGTMGVANVGGETGAIWW